VTEPDPTSGVATIDIDWLAESVGETPLVPVTAGEAAIDIEWLVTAIGETPGDRAIGETTGDVGWLIESSGAAPPEPAPDPILDQERLNSVREGMAAGRDMGIWAEIVHIVDAIIELRDTDQLIIHEAQIALQNIVTAATNAIGELRAQAKAGFDNVNNRIDNVTASGSHAIQELAASTDTAIASVRTDAGAAIAQLRTDATAGINGEANTRGQADVALQANITGLSTATTNAITADRARLTTIEGAITQANTGILARLTKIEQRLTAAGIP